ncbi:hypothetical protein [Actinoplanes sp. RD1]|uniref:hypothetical protein n=1 Tax=Actinoplanes sp. RD1 TaxID=3064538 RepID=UPI00274120B9|nr:hypothetical protein [Actinoplanes sp. RD1]
MMRRLVRLPALTVLVTGTLLGCGSSPEATTPQVATLQSSPVRASASTDPEDLRPLIRPDTSQAEQDRLVAIWTTCLTTEDGTTARYTKRWAVGREKANDARWQAAKAACRSKEPEDFTDREMRKDLPAFKDKQRIFHDCAEQKGYDLTPLDPATGLFGLERVGPNGDWDSAGIKECQRQAFSEAARSRD